MDETALAPFRTAFEASPSAMLLMDADGEVVLTNPRMDALFGYEPGELVGQKIEVLVPAELREIHPELRDAFFRLPSTRDMGVGRELYGVAKCGRRIPLEIGLNPVAVDDVTFVLASILDITARRRQEDKVRRAIDAASTAMIMVDVSGAVVLTNRQTHELFGYTERELAGQPIEMLIPERFRRRHAVYRTSFVQAPKRRRMGDGYDLHAVCKDGTEVPVEVGLTPIDTHDGTFIMCTVQDVSLTRQHERELSLRNEELGRLNEELSHFAYSASHDLKAPLTSIAGLLSCVADDLEANELSEAVRNVGRARDLAAQLARRVESMLALARSDHQDEKWEHIAVSELVDEITSRLEGTIRYRGVRVSLEVGDVDVIHADRGRLSQVLENLVENAIKYADRAKAERNVVITVRRCESGTRIAVEDNGIGIPLERQADVFKMFKRFGNHREPGSGLGLALARKHIDRLGGTIQFASSEAGTTFELELPGRAPGVDASASAPVSRESGSSGRPI